jgi:hypothetical protein
LLARFLIDAMSNVLTLQESTKAQQIDFYGQARRSNHHP